MFVVLRRWCCEIFDDSLSPSLFVNNINCHQHSPTTQVFTPHQGQILISLYLKVSVQMAVIVTGQEFLVWPTGKLLKLPVQVC